MRTTKIDFKAKIILTFSGLSLISVLFFSCDVMEPDADLLKPAVGIHEDQVYVISNNSAFIDLNAKIRTTQPIRINVTSPTKLGILTDLGKGLLQYTPAAGKRNVRDAFEFTVRGDNNEILKIDTITISVENDSTYLPCGIFPTDDYVYGAKELIPLNIPVLTNDYLCALDSSDLVLSVFRPDNTFPPFYGTADVAGRSVMYTASGLFEGSDKIIYKVQSKSDPAKASYGLVYVFREQACDFFVRDDFFQIGSDSIAHWIDIPAFSNDSLCYPILNYQINVQESPARGEVTLNATGFSYRKTSAADTSVFADSFVYEVCKDARCKTARVSLNLKVDSARCTFMAVPDSIDLSKNSITPIYLDVLFNDKVCDGYSEFTITEQPPNGLAAISHDRILYERDPLVHKNDSLEYKICNGQECSSAKVFIKRKA